MKIIKPDLVLGRYIEVVGQTEELDEDFKERPLLDQISNIVEYSSTVSYQGVLFDVREVELMIGALRQIRSSYNMQERSGMNLLPILAVDLQSLFRGTLLEDIHTFIIRSDMSFGSTINSDDISLVLTRYSRFKR